MDPIKKEKLQAMKKYRNQFFNDLILNFLTALTCILFCSSPFWFPSLCSSMKSFLFVSLPNIGSFIFNPKSLFIVCNIIIVFLVGQSKLGDSYPSRETDIYDEYVERKQSLRGPVEKKEERKLELPFIEESVERVQEDKEEKGGAKKEEKMEREEEVDGEEEFGLPADELKKRVEDFIARVNRQRRIEANQLSCSA